MNAWVDTMRSLLGKRVKVTLSNEPENGAHLIGTLVSFDEGGEVCVRADDGFLHWGWPNLFTELHEQR